MKEQEKNTPQEAKPEDKRHLMGNPKFVACVLAVTAVMLIVWRASSSSSRAEAETVLTVCAPAPKAPKVRSEKIMMTNEIAVPIPFGYHLDVNWGYAPVDVITNADLVPIPLPQGYTECGSTEKIMLREHPGYEVKPIQLYCTYTEAEVKKPGYLGH